MVERKADGSLRQTYRLPEDDWLREGGTEYRIALAAEQERLNRPLTDQEAEELRSSLTTD